MIVSENVTLTLKKPFDNTDIEAALFEKGIEPLRWAIVSASEQECVLNVSYIKEI